MQIVYFIELKHSTGSWYPIALEFDSEEEALNHVINSRTHTALVFRIRSKVIH